MPRKKAPNWEDIKTRYVVHGEKPSDIAKVYDVAAKTISNRACEEKWGEEQGKIGKEIFEEAIANRKRIFTKIGVALEYMLDNIISELPNMGATIQDGEGFHNKYHLEAWRSCVAAFLKPDVEQESADPPKTVLIHGVDEDAI